MINLTFEQAKEFAECGKYRSIPLSTEIFSDMKTPVAVLGILQRCGARIPILGVCLGHQSICRAFGGTVGYAKRLMHGKMSEIKVDNNTLLFKGLPEYIEAARYHSLAAEGGTLPDELAVTAKTEDGEIMAVQHKTRPVYGVQFHPESILTPMGKVIIKNFLKS